LPDPGDGILAMGDISNFTTTKIVDKRPGRSGVEYKRGRHKWDMFISRLYENEVVPARRLRILRKRKLEFS